MAAPDITQDTPSLYLIEMTPLTHLNNNLMTVKGEKNLKILKKNTAMQTRNKNNAKSHLK